MTKTMNPTNLDFQKNEFGSLSDISVVALNSLRQATKEAMESSAQTSEEVQAYLKSVAEQVNGAEVVKPKFAQSPASTKADHPMPTEPKPQKPSAVPSDVEQPEQPPALQAQQMSPRLTESMQAVQDAVKEALQVAIKEAVQTAVNEVVEIAMRESKQPSESQEGASP